MPAKIYYDKDADLSLLKDMTLSILGYGSQGHAHAQNLRDSGLNVLVAELPGSANYELAVKDGFQPVSAEEATDKGDMVTILLPAARFIVVEQARAGLPSISIKQAPQAACPVQPSLTEVIPFSSRRKLKSDVFSSPANSVS